MQKFYIFHAMKPNPDILYAADYYPGGMLLPGRLYEQSTYRFGYQGAFAEKDEETGYNQFEARLYDSRINRWLTTDPAGQYWSPYLGMGNNWANGVDPDGRWFSQNRAERQRQSAIHQGQNVGELIKIGNQWGFQTSGPDYTAFNFRKNWMGNEKKWDRLIPTYLPSSKRLNPYHPKYKKFYRQERREEKYWEQQRAMEGQRGWDSRGKYIIGGVATICSMGTAEIFGVATTVTRIAGSASIVKNVINYGDSPILDPNGLGSQIPGVAVDATNVVLEIHGITQGDFSGVVSLPTDAKSLWDNSIGIIKNSTGD